MKPPILLKYFKKEFNNRYDSFGINNNYILGAMNLGLPKTESLNYDYKNKFYHFTKTR